MHKYKFVFIFLVLIISSVIFAEPLDNWHWRNPLPQGNEIKGIYWGNNNFSFSIIGWLNKTNFEQQNPLFIAIHEISHFIFFDIVNALHRENKIKPLHQEVAYYLQENLTAMLLNQEPLHDILGLSTYKGNLSTQAIWLKKENGEVVRFTNFLLEEYNKIKTGEIESFKIYILKMVHIFNPLSSQFIKRRKLWNQYGKQVFKDKKLSALHKKPIEIQI